MVKYLGFLKGANSKVFFPTCLLNKLNWSLRTKSGIVQETSLYVFRKQYTKGSLDEMSSFFCLLTHSFIKLQGLVIDLGSG